MWNDPGETIVAGTGQAYVAPVGTALPTTAVAALNAAFYGLGYHTEEGVSINQAVDISEFRVWQSKYVVRRVRNTEDFTLSFQLVQFNEETLPLAFGGGEVVSDGSTGFRYNPPSANDAVDERSMVIDVIDGDMVGRFVIPKGSVSEPVETSFNRTNLSQLPISFKAQEPDDGSLPWYFLTNADGFTAGS